MFKTRVQANYKSARKRNVNQLPGIVSASNSLHLLSVVPKPLWHALSNRKQYLKPYPRIPPLRRKFMAYWTYKRLLDRVALRPQQIVREFHSRLWPRFPKNPPLILLNWDSRLQITQKRRVKSPDTQLCYELTSFSEDLFPNHAYRRLQSPTVKSSDIEYAQPENKCAPHPMPKIFLVSFRKTTLILVRLNRY